VPKSPAMPQMVSKALIEHSIKARSFG